MLKLQNISVQYGKTQVLSDVSTTLAPHSLNILIGPNGTGKSSLLRAIAGLIPSSGKVFLSDKELATPSEKSEQITYMHQDVNQTSSLTVLEVVLLGRLRQLGLRIPRAFQDEAMQMLTHLGVDHLVHRTLSELSGGQRQLVYVAQSLFRRPKVLLLDEPTAALDLRHQLLVINAVNTYAAENNVIVVAAVHDLTLCGHFADRVLCLSGGTISSDGAAEAVLTSSNIKTMYDVEARVTRDDDGYLSIIPIAPVDAKLKSSADVVK